MSKNTLALIASLLITLSASAEDMKLKYESCDMGVNNHADAWEQVYNSLIENSNNAIVMKKPEQSVVINDMSSYDATMMKDESHNWVATPEAVKKYGYYTPLREFEWSTVPLIAFGFAAKANKKNFRAARNNFIPAYENRFDDNLQLVPLVVASGLNFAGYQGRSNTGRYLASGALSYAWCALFVNSIKYTAKEMRPDGSTANSFPSGHTATAFTAATIMHKEYGLTRSPWWSIFGYGCATTTGIMRTLNNRHWISDVLVGAGLGIISTDLGYMCADWIFKKKGINREPLENTSNLWQNPSFFKLELGMQLTNDLKLPTNTSFLTTANLYTIPYSVTATHSAYLTTTMPRSASSRITPLVLLHTQKDSHQG